MANFDAELESFLIEQWVEEACDLAGCAALADDIEIRWNRRMTTCLGRASRADYHIDLALKAWPLLEEDQRKETVFHEVAHLIAFYRHGLDGWGHYWQFYQAMSDIGYPNANRCHNLRAALKPLERKLSRVIAYCSCMSASDEAVEAKVRLADGAHLFTLQKAKKSRAGTHSFTCRQCGDEISVTTQKIKV